MEGGGGGRSRCWPLSRQAPQLIQDHLLNNSFRAKSEFCFYIKIVSFLFVSFFFFYS